MLADKADTGRIFSGGYQPQIFGDFTHLRFFQLANREQTLRNLPATKRRGSSSDLAAVEPAQQPAFAVYIRAADVVTGGDIVGA